MLTMQEQRLNLDLSVEQRIALTAINAAYLATRAFGTDFGVLLHTNVAPFLSQAVDETVSGLNCPYGSGGVKVIRDFDGSRNMYMHCLHSPQHCWNMMGDYKTCP